MFCFFYQKEIVGDASFYYDNFSFLESYLKEYDFMYFFRDLISLIVASYTSWFFGFLLNKIDVIIGQDGKSKFSVSTKNLFSLYGIFTLSSFIVTSVSFVVWMYGASKWQTTMCIVLVWITLLVIISKVCSKLDDFLYTKILSSIKIENNLTDNHFEFVDDDDGYTVIFYPDNYKFACTRISTANYGLHDLSVIKRCDLSSKTETKTKVTTKPSKIKMREGIFGGVVGNITGGGTKVTETKITTHLITIDCFNKEKDFGFSIIKTYEDQNISNAKYMYNKINSILEDYSSSYASND